jgi:hypothetical protein
MPDNRATVFQAEDLQWDMPGAVLNQVMMGFPAVVGTYAIARWKPVKLLVYLPLVAGFFTAWRRFVCARCRYYGRECSTLMGITTSWMMPHDEEKPLDRKAMVADFTYITIIGLMPLRQVMKRPVLALLYTFGLLAAVSSILFNACWRCGNEFCPLKSISRKISVQARG